MKKYLGILFALVLALSFSLMPAAPAAAATLNVGPGETYATIQAAINAANPSDTINVAAGTYPENVVIPGDKDNLQLLGAGSSETSINPPGGRPVALQGYPLDRPIDGVKIQGFTLVVADASHAFIALSSTPDNNPYTTNLELEDIIVDGGQRGIGLNAVNGVTLTDVYIGNISGSLEAALELTGVSNLTFTDGSIEGNKIGVRLQPTGSGQVGDGYGPNGNIQIHNSNLTGNSLAVENQDSGIVIDATNNWWGDKTGPQHATNPSGTGDPVSNYVKFTPWLTGPWTGGSVGMLANVPDIIAISVDPTSIDFGILIPGATSAVQDIDVENIGTHTVDVTAHISGEAGDLFFDNLKLKNFPVAWGNCGGAGNWNDIITDLAMNASDTVSSRLSVPLDYTPSGPETATLAFIAAPK